MANDSHAHVIASVSPVLKADALRALDALDLSMSEYLRLALAHVVQHGTLPFEVSPRARHRNCVIFQEAAAAV